MGVFALALPGPASATTGGGITVSGSNSMTIMLGDQYTAKADGSTTITAPMPAWLPATTYTVSVTGTLGNEYVVCESGGGVWTGPMTGTGSVFANWAGPTVAPVVLTASQLPATLAVPTGSGSMVCFVASDLGDTTELGRAYGYDVDLNWTGNIGSFEQFQVAVDPTTPSVALSGASTASWLPAASVTATGSESPALSGVESVGCATGSPPEWTAGTGSYSRSTFTAARNGADTISCTSETAAQVSSTPASETVYVDSQSPTIAFPDAPSSRWSPTPVTIHPTATEATNVSGIASEACSVDGAQDQTSYGTGAALTSGANTGTLVDPVVVSANGNNTVRCVAATNAGVSSGTISSGDGVSSFINVDTQTPSLAISGPATEGWVDPWLEPYVNDALSPETVTGSEPTAASGIGKVACSVNGAAATTIASQAASLQRPNGRTLSGSLDLFGAANGIAEVDCTATTNAGISSTATGHSYVDAQTPTITFSGAAATVTGDSAQVTAEAAEGTDLSGIASETCAVDNGSPETVDGATPQLAVGVNSRAVQQSLIANGSGSHTISCSATTNAGATTSLSKTVILVAPVSSPKSPPASPPSSVAQGPEAPTTTPTTADPQLKPPRISGAARVGALLRVSVASRRPFGVKWSYQWFASGKRIRGATRASLRLRMAQEDTRITVVVIATERGHAPISKRSAATRVIRK